MTHVTVPAACHTAPVHHDHRVRDLVHQLGASIVAHLHSRAWNLEQEAAELRRQAAGHTAACEAAGITFMDVPGLTRPSTVTGAAQPAAPASVDGCAGRRFDVA